MQDDNFSDPALYRPSLPYCPLCGSGEIVQHYIIERYTPPFKTDRCMNCGFIFMNPRFNEAIMTSLYGEGYYRGGADYTYYDERDAERYSRHVWNSRIKKIRSFIDNGNLLDIGCAFGGFLKAASPYYNPFGIEISDYAGRHAQSEFGEKIHAGSLEDHPFQSEFFSIITMIEVLEHLPDPVVSITECFNLLKRGGLLVIQTANMNGLQARLLKDSYAYFMPGHFSYFTKDNLKILLEKTGFREIRVFHPVEFGLLPKLLKSRYGFRSVKDYRKWLRIAAYHYLSKIRYRSFALTSSMVFYALK
jgi:2-polyprenyl-3-methyl-5-hydroxy-6-metoxy-1,4-benzoquinol methylase